MAYTSAEVLNPTSAATMLVVEITDAMKDLGSHFGIDEFREGHGIIDDMILEIGTYKKLPHLQMMHSGILWMDPQCMMKSLFPGLQKGNLPIMLHGKMIQSDRKACMGVLGGAQKECGNIPHCKSSPSNSTSANQQCQ